MSGFRRSRGGPVDSGDPLESLLRTQFSREIEAQRDEVPSAEFIQALAASSPSARPRFASGIREGWPDALVLGTVATLVASWWDEATTGLNSLLLLESIGMPWIANLGMLGALLAFTLCWTLSQGRTA